MRLTTLFILCALSAVFGISQMNNQMWQAKEKMGISGPAYFELPNLERHLTPLDTLTLKEALEDTTEYDSTEIRNFYIKSVEDSLEGSIYLKSNAKYTFSPDCKFYKKFDSKWGTSEPIFKLDTLSNVILDLQMANFDGQIDSTGNQNMWDHLVQLDHCENIVLRNFNARNFAGDMIYGVACKDILIESFFMDCLHLGKFDSTGTRSALDVFYLGRNGIAFVANTGDSCKRIIIQNGTILNGAPAAIDLEPNAGGGIADVVIDDVVAQCKLSGIAQVDERIGPYGFNVYCGASGSWARNIIISNSVINGYRHYGINAYGDVQGLNINNTIVDGCGQYGLHLASTFTYLNNIESKNNTYSGLKAYGEAGHLYISNSKFHDNGTYGVDIHGLTDNRFEHVYLNNVIAWDNAKIDTLKTGIYLQNTDTCAVQNCMSFSSGNQQRYGFFNTNCSFLRFANNWSFGNWQNEPEFSGTTGLLQQSTAVNDSVAWKEVANRFAVMTRDMSAGNTWHYFPDSLSSNMFDAGKGSYESDTESWYEVLTFECYIERVSGGSSGSYSVRFRYKGSATASVPGLYLNDSGTGTETGDLQVDPSKGSAWRLKFDYKANHNITGYLNGGSATIGNERVNEFSLRAAESWTEFEYDFGATDSNPYLYFYIRDGDTLHVDNMRMYRIVGGDVFVNGEFWYSDTDSLIQLPAIVGMTDSVRVDSVYLPTTDFLKNAISDSLDGFSFGGGDITAVTVSGGLLTGGGVTDSVNVDLQASDIETACDLNNFGISGHVDLTSSYHVKSAGFWTDYTYLLNYTLYNNIRTAYLSMYGGNSYLSGGALQLYGDTHSSLPGRVNLIYGSGLTNLSAGTYFALQAKDNGVGYNTMTGDLLGNATFPQNVTISGDLDANYVEVNPATDADGVVVNLPSGSGGEMWTGNKGTDMVSIINQDGDLYTPEVHFIDGSYAGGVVGTLNGVQIDGSDPEIKIDGTWYTIGSGGGSGDITSVVAGSGLSGGATSGDATLNNSYASSNSSAHYAGSYRLSNTYLVNRVLYNNDRSGYLAMYGGSSWERGSFFEFYGDQHTTRPGWLNIYYGANATDLSAGTYFRLGAKDNGVTAYLLKGDLEGNADFDNDVNIDGSCTVDDFLLLTPQSAAPSSPSEGMIYYDSDDDKVKVYTSAGWVDLN